jgi:lysophospholipase L1-like esterase
VAKWTASGSTNPPAFEADGIFASVMRALAAGRSAAIQVQGDSTGNATDEWPYLLADWAADRHPTAHVRYKVWNDTAQAYGAWTTIQSGAGERHALFVPANARSMYLPTTAMPHIGGDIDIRVRVALDDWTAGATQTLVARYGGAGAHSWKLELNTGNAVSFAWSVDGTTDIQKVATAPPFADGAEGWIRCTLDVDNGAGGYTWKCYWSTDGLTWTEIGSSITPSGGATSIFNSPYEYEIGARGLVGGNIEGKIFEVQIRDGIDGKIVNPQPIDSWIGRGPSGSYVAGHFGGGPTLYVLNGSHPGASATYLADATRHPKMVQPYAGSLIFQSCSHNDGDGQGATYLAARDAWLALTEARAPGCQTVIVTQNPQAAPMEAHTIENHARRRQLLMAWAARKGLAVVDTYQAFLDTASWESALLQSDGLHPNSAGEQVWLDAVTRAMRAAA